MTTASETPETSAGVSPELLDIVKEVAELTGKGWLPWAPTDTPGVAVSLASAAIFMDQRYLDDILHFTVRNEKGDRVHHLRAEPGNPWYPEVERAYQLARQQALEAPASLRNMRKAVALGRI